MPFNPGNQDISGQLLGNGIQQFAQGINAAAQTYTQNKLLTNDAIGKFEGAVRANPEILQFLSGGDEQNANRPPISPEVISAFNKLQKGGVALKDAAILGQFADSYQNTKKQQSAQALQAAQIEQANAASRESAALAAQHEAQTKIMLEQQKRLNDMLTGAHPELANQDAKDASGPKAVPFHAPTTPPPTRIGIARDLAMASGKMPTASEIDSGYNSAYTNWASIERPLGYVPGGTDEVKDGKDAQIYYLVTIKNNGTILKSSTPVRILKGSPAPGIVLDEKNGYQPLAAQPPVVGQPTAPGQPPAIPNYSTKAKVEMIDAADSIQKLTQAQAILDQLDKVNDVMKSVRTDRASGLTGNDFWNKKVAPALFNDQTGLTFDSLVSTLTSDVMANVKNIRNVFEFKAVTGNIPKSDMPYSTRQQLLNTYRKKVEDGLQRLQTGAQLMQAGVEPEDAWMQATPGAKKEEVGTATTVRQPTVIKSTRRVGG